MKNIMAMVLALVMALVAVPAMAETSRVYTLEELRSMSGEQLMALAIKDGSVQAKRAIGEGDQEIGLFEVAVGTKAAGNGRRLFVDLINEQERLDARESTAKWSSSFDTEGYCVSWYSAKSSNGLVKSDEAVKVRFFREVETGKVYVIIRGNAVADNNTGTGSTGNTGTGSTGNTGNGSSGNNGGGNNGNNGGNQQAAGEETHQHASFTAQPAGDNGSQSTNSGSSQHASFTAGSTGNQSTNSGSSQSAGFTAGSTGNQSTNSGSSQSAGFTAGSAGGSKSNSELTQEQLRNKTGFHK